MVPFVVDVPAVKSAALVAALNADVDPERTHPVKSPVSKSPLVTMLVAEAELVAQTAIDKAEIIAKIVFIISGSPILPNIAETNVFFKRKQLVTVIVQKLFLPK